MTPRGSTAAPVTWLYFKLYPGGLELLDRALLDVVAPFAGRAAGSARRWFFLRYVDGTGPHVRLRLLVPWATADELAAWHGTLRAPLRELSAQPLLPPREPPLALPGTLPATGSPASPDVRLDVYEPELAKWGGPDYLPAAERMFQLSSELALALLRTLDGTAENRLALGCLITARLLAALPVSDPERERFLDTHYQWWTGSHTGGQAARDQAAKAARDTLAPRVLARTRALAADDAAAPAAGRFAHQVLAVLAEGSPRQKPLFLVFHHLHLMLNRLGIVPDEEAVVSLLARAYRDGP